MSTASPISGPSPARSPAGTPTGLWSPPIASSERRLCAASVCLTHRPTDSRFLHLLETKSPRVLADRRLLAVALVSALIGCAIGVFASARYVRAALAERATHANERAEPGAVYSPVSVQALPGWSEDSVSQALGPLRSACRQLAGLSDDAIIGIGPIARPASAWHTACAALA